MFEKKKEKNGTLSHTPDMNEYEKNKLQPKPLKDKLPKNLIIPVLDKLQPISQRQLRIYIFPLLPEITLLKFGAQWPI